MAVSRFAPDVCTLRHSPAELHHSARCRQSLHQRTLNPAGRERSCPAIAPPERFRVGIQPPCTPHYTHRSVAARNGQNSSSPSTSVDIPARRQCRRLPLQGLDARHHRAPLRASRLTLRSLLLRPVRPARRGRPSRRCCAPAPGSPVNRTPHETLDHPTVAFCRTAKGLESGVMRAGPVRRCRPMLAAPVRSSAPPASRRVPCFPAPSARRGAGALFAAKPCPPNRAVDRRQGRVFHCRPRYHYEFGNAPSSCP